MHLEMDLHALAEKTNAAKDIKAADDIRAAEYTPGRGNEGLDDIFMVYTTPSSKRCCIFRWVEVLVGQWNSKGVTRPEAEGNDITFTRLMIPSPTQET
jgi:hypothetical protein